MVGWTDEDDVAVEFEVPLIEVDVWVAPTSSVWEFVEVLVDEVEFVPLLTIVVPSPRMVVYPKVVVRVVEPLVTVERIADVVIAEEERVIVDP